MLARSARPPPSLKIRPPRGPHRTRDAAGSTQLGSRLQRKCLEHRRRIARADGEGDRGVERAVDTPEHERHDEHECARRATTLLRVGWCAAHGSARGAPMMTLKKEAI